MPFGLKTPSGAFQGSMDVILSTCNGQLGLFYLVDLLIFRKSSEALIKRLRLVLKLIHNTGLTIELKKYNFFKHSKLHVSITLDRWQAHNTHYYD